MAERRTEFRENVEDVKEDADKDSQRLVLRLKQMTPAEFLRLPSKTFASLTAKQYREIVAAIAPDVKIPKLPRSARYSPETSKTLRDWWRRRSILTQMITATVAITMICVAAAIESPLAWKWILSRMELVRPHSTSNWPVCARLSEHTDGCVYYPTRDLNWSEVAGQLSMSIPEMQQTNPHLPSQFIPATAPLAIWRHRGRLEN